MDNLTVQMCKDYLSFIKREKIEVGTILTNGKSEYIIKGANVSLSIGFIVTNKRDTITVYLTIDTILSENWHNSGNKIENYNNGIYYDIKEFSDILKMMLGLKLGDVYFSKTKGYFVVRKPNNSITQTEIILVPLKSANKVQIEQYLVENLNELKTVYLGNLFVYQNYIMIHNAFNWYKVFDLDDTVSMKLRLYGV